MSTIAAPAATPTATPSAKQTALDVINHLPSSVTLEKICEELAILAAIRRGEAELDAGLGIPHDEAVRRLQSWTSK